MMKDKIVEILGEIKRECNTCKADECALCDIDSCWSMSNEYKNEIAEKIMEVVGNER